MLTTVREKLTPWLMSTLCSRFYYHYSDQGWTMVCAPPEIMNIAMPDFTVRYYVLYSADDLILEGEFPKGENYCSFNVYNTMGISISTLNDVDLPGKFKVCVTGTKNDQYEKFLDRPKGPYCLIMRVYFKSANIKWESVPLPKVSLVTKTGALKELPVMSVETIKKNSIRLEKFFHYGMSFRYVGKYPENTQFVMPIVAKNGLFANIDSGYLVTLPTPGKTVIITGKKPSKLGPEYSLRYVGFMTCDVHTTRTNDSYNLEDMKKTDYKIFVSYSKEEATKKGFKEGEDGLLLWQANTAMPALIYREVRIDHSEGTFIIGSSQEEEAAKALGEYYPRLQFV